MLSSRKERTRARILEAARRLLVARGYHGVGMEEIATAAGVSRQAVYLHFGSKAELMLAMVEHIDLTEGLYEVLEPFRAARTPLEALDAAVGVEATYEPRIYDIASVLYRARQSDPAAETAWQDRMVRRRSGWRELMEWLQRDGLLAEGWTVDDAADFVWALLSVHVYEYLVVERGWSTEQFADHLRSVLRRTLLRPGPAPRAGNEYQAQP